MALLRSIGPSSGLLLAAYWLLFGRLFGLLGREGQLDPIQVYSVLDTDSPSLEVDRPFETDPTLADWPAVRPCRQHAITAGPTV